MAFAKRFPALVKQGYEYPYQFIGISLPSSLSLSSPPPLEFPPFHFSLFFLSLPFRSFVRYLFLPLRPSPLSKGLPPLADRFLSLSRSLSLPLSLFLQSGLRMYSSSNKACVCPPLPFILFTLIYPHSLFFSPFLHPFFFFINLLLI